VHFVIKDISNYNGNMKSAIVLSAVISLSSAATYTWNGPNFLQFNDASSWTGTGNPAGSTFPTSTTYGVSGRGSMTSTLTGTVDVGSSLTFSGSAEIVLGANSAIEFNSPTNTNRGGVATWITLDTGFQNPRAASAGSRIGGMAAMADYNCPLNWRVDDGTVPLVPPTVSDDVIINSGGKYVSTFGHQAQAMSINAAWTASSSPSLCTAHPGGIVFPSTGSLAASVLDFGSTCSVVMAGRPRPVNPSCGNLHVTTLEGSSPGTTVQLYTCADGTEDCGSLGGTAVIVNNATGTASITPASFDSATQTYTVTGASQTAVISSTGDVTPVGGSADSSAGGGSSSSGGGILLYIIIAAVVVVLVVAIIVVKKRSGGGGAGSSATQPRSFGGVGFENPLYDERGAEGGEGMYADSPGQAGDYMDLPEGEDSAAGYMDVPNAEEPSYDVNAYDDDSDNDEDDNNDQVANGGYMDVDAADDVDDEGF
jgi:hypothetical protein